MATRDFLIGAIIGGALVGGIIVWRPLHKDTPIDHQITFGAYSYSDNEPDEDGWIMIHGSLNNPNIPDNDPNQPDNNTYTIECSRSEMACHVASVEQVSENQVDAILTVDYTITSWTPSEVIATNYNGNNFSCTKTTISIDRSKQKTYYITQPVNIERPFCAKASTKTTKQTIEDSRVWRYLNAATQVR